MYTYLDHIIVHKLLMPLYLTLSKPATKLNSNSTPSPEQYALQVFLIQNYLKNMLNCHKPKYYVL